MQIKLLQSPTEQNTLTKTLFKKQSLDFLQMTLMGPVGLESISVGSPLL